MRNTPFARLADNEHPLTTEEFAARLGIKPQTLRAAVCRNGHYFGVRPAKSINRFLLWPADAPQRLTTGGVA